MEEVKRRHTPPLPLAPVTRSRAGSSVDDATPPRNDAVAPRTGQRSAQIRGSEAPMARRTAVSLYPGGHGAGGSRAQPDRGQPQQHNPGSFWTDADTERNLRLTTVDGSPEDFFRRPTLSTQTPQSTSLTAKFKSLVTKSDAPKGDNPKKKLRPEDGHVTNMLLGLRSKTFQNGSLKELRASFSGNDNKVTQEFARITEGQLESMSIEDVEAIHREAASQCARGECDKFVSLVRDMAASVLRNINPALSPVLQQMLKAVGNPPDVPGETREVTVGRLFSEAVQFASRQDASQYDATKSAAQTPYEVVLDTLAYLMKNGVSAEAMRSLVQAFPPDELRALAGVQDVVGHGSINRALMVEFAQSAVKAVQATALAKFTEAVENVSNWPLNDKTHELRDPPGLVATVIEAANQLRRFQFYGGKVDERTYTSSQNDLSGVLALLSDANNLSDVPDLGPFTEALQTLYFEGDCGISVESGRRKQVTTAAREAVAGQVIGLLQNAAGKSPLEIVTTIRRALDQRAVSGLRRNTFASELREFAQALPESERSALLRSMGSEEMQTLGGVLTEISRAGAVKEFVELARELDEIASVLASVRDAVSPGLTSKDEGQWTIVDDLDKVLKFDPKNPLKPDLQSLLSSLNIKMHEGELTVTLAAAPVRFLAAVTNTIKSFKVPEVSQPLELDAPGTTYKINGADASAQMVGALVGGNQRVLGALSQVLSPANWGAVDQLLQTEDTPFRAGSKPVEYLGTPTWTFDIRSDERGGLIVERTLSITEAGSARVVQPKNDEGLLFVLLDKPPAITTKLTISSTGLANPLGSTVVSSDFVEIEWDEEYPRPVSVRSVIAPDADVRALDRFTDFLQKEFSSENLNFLLDLNDFEAAPTFASATALAAKYMTVGSAYEVNVSSTLRLAFQSALDAPGANNLSGDALIRLWAPARAEVIALMGRDSFNRFTREIAIPKKSAPNVPVAAASDGSGAAAPLDPKRDKIRRDVGVQFGWLARSPNPSDVDGGIDRVKYAMVGNSDHSEYWDELAQHVQARLEVLPQDVIRSILMNLSKSQDASNVSHVEFLTAAVQSHVKGTRLGRMNLEGVLAERASNLPIGQLATWFDSGRITEYELFTALKKVGPINLRDAAKLRTKDGQFRLCAERVLAAQTRELGAAMDDIESRINDIAQSTQPLTNGVLRNLLGLAADLLSYIDLRAKLGDPTAGADRVIARARHGLTTWLQSQLANPAAGLTADVLRTNRLCLEVFGISSGTLTETVGLLTARETAANAQRPKQQAQPLSQARIPPRPPPRMSQAQDVPPPPELPPPGDDVPPPPELSPTEDDPLPPPDDPNA